MWLLRFSSCFLPNVGPKTEQVWSNKGTTGRQRADVRVRCCCCCRSPSSHWLSGFLSKRPLPARHDTHMMAATSAGLSSVHCVPCDMDNRFPPADGEARIIWFTVNTGEAWNHTQRSMWGLLFQLQPKYVHRGLSFPQPTSLLFHSKHVAHPLRLLKINCWLFYFQGCLFIGGLLQIQTGHI